ncbi:hypothetical protein ACF3DV_03675 [Chlorogloeopsis fritschii PCC 9212]|uniref:hypothetical protein n=1 Tax=Chlorogloeopsis fritschii TaxID=1124 RepID=UPI000368F044
MVYSVCFLVRQELESKDRTQKGNLRRQLATAHNSTKNTKNFRQSSICSKPAIAIITK